MLEPYQGRVYDPCCGSSRMFVQSVNFIRAHATGNGNGGTAHGDSFHNDRHPALKADYILAYPPFSVSDWGGERLRDDKR